MKTEKIISCISLGERDCFDLEIDSEFHNFYANGIVVSNSHAFSYAAIAAVTAKLKGEYPKEFFLEALKMAQKKADPFEQVALIQQELPYFGIKLLPPDLVQSNMDFSIEGSDIRFGLSAIKGVAEKALAKLQSFLDKQKTNKFQVFFAAKESGLNIAVLAALIQSGCLQSMGSNRPKMTLEAQVWGKLNERERNYCLINGEKYGYDLINALRDYTNWNDGKPFKETRLATIRKQTAPYMEIFSKNSKFPKFANFIYEKSLLGYSWSGTLREIFVNECPNLKSCDEVKNQVDKDNPVDIVAIVAETKKGKSKAGNDYLRMTVSDETGTITAIMTKDKLARFLDNNTIPAEGEIVHLEGTKNDDGMWLNRCSTYKERIYFRASELKKYEESV